MAKGSTKRGTVTGLRQHPYCHDQATDRCRTCSLPKRNELHQLPPASAAARARDAGVLGEHDTDEDYY